MTGTLYLVSTPIGNLEDITLRAIRTLKEVDLIAAEDTRHTIKLLNHFGISKSMTSFFRHNESQKGEYIVNKLLAGENIALVSDAGTPGISDPGEELAAMAIAKGITVSPIPGPVAAISGIIVSGLPTGRFTFEGFLPINKRIRKERLDSLKDEVRTMVFYEAPHKLIHTLKDFYGAFGNRKVVLARELTKMFEDVIRTSLQDAIRIYEENDPRGEFVVIVDGCPENTGDSNFDWDGLSVKQHVQAYIELGLDQKEAMKKTAKERNINKKDVYKELIKEKN
jgi:16S rRNA (cytidine1402-2'-O)-methyltransferase